MNQIAPRMVLTLAVLMAAVAGCSPASTTAPTNTIPPSPTPDPCSVDNLPQTVKPVNDLMRQFDDYSILASNIVQSQVPMVIPPMQRIRRSAQDQQVPACLDELKRLQLAYMDATLEALLSFQSNPKASQLARSIATARQYHTDYNFELSHLLGIPIVTATPRQ